MGCVFLFLLKTQGPLSQGLREHSKRKLIHTFVKGRADLVTGLCHLLAKPSCSKGCPVLQSLPSTPRDVVFPFSSVSCTANNNPHSLLPGSCSKVAPSSATLSPIAVWPQGQNWLSLDFPTSPGPHSFLLPSSF